MVSPQGKCHHTNTSKLWMQWGVERSYFNSMGRCVTELQLFWRYCWAFVLSPYEHRTVLNTVCCQTLASVYWYWSTLQMPFSDRLSECLLQSYEDILMILLCLFPVNQHQRKLSNTWPWLLFALTAHIAVATRSF